MNLSGKTAVLPMRDQRLNPNPDQDSKLVSMTLVTKPSKSQSRYPDELASNEKDKIKSS
jgi:hypothetical protein